MNKSPKYDLTLGKAAKALLTFTDNAQFREFDSIRVARSVLALLISGCSVSNSRIQTAIHKIKKSQRPDGGWADPTETAWAVGAIKLVKGAGEASLELAYHWLQINRTPTGGWGYHHRDQARIPVTALVSEFAPNILRTVDKSWIINEWRKEFYGPVRLSYKAGFFLLAMAQSDGQEFVRETIAYISEDQNNDGGFAPWQGHPIGSDPWSTGVVLWGLSRWITSVDKAVIHKAMAWLKRTQLPSGYWPYHYLDDGTSLALIGAVAAMKALASTE